MTLLYVFREPFLGLFCVFSKASKLKKNPRPFMGSGVGEGRGTFLSDTWKESLSGFAMAVSFLRAALWKLSTPLFYGTCQWKIGGVPP